jgi:excinuclease ABC subunit A
LHQSDNDKLINSLKNLRDLGNTILLLTDRETIEHSDYIVDLGPKAGEFGGDIFMPKNRRHVRYKPKS